MLTKKLTKAQIFLIVILLLALFLRVFRLNFPNKYVFDEVYHAFTAKEYLAGHKEAWEWWTTPPPGVAYEWTHPPLAKEIMAGSMFILRSTDAWAWRLPGALLGVISIFLLYLLAKSLFKNESAALISAFIFSLDGLNFVQSRTGMNDIYVVTAILLCLVLFFRKHFLFSAIALGLAISSKWTGLYLFGIVIILTFKYRTFKFLPYYLIIPPIIYLFSYLPFFLLGHNLQTFWGLQEQMWWYHSRLKATHDYASPWWSWPFNLYPVWYFVDYGKNTIANIFASGNPIIFWSGFGAILVTIWDFTKLVLSLSHRPLLSIKHFYMTSLNDLQTADGLFVGLLGFFSFLLPWALSPRIMFLYHYSPCVPFLSLCLGYQISLLAHGKKDRILLIAILMLILAGFLFYYPMLTGIPLPRDLMLLFFKTNLTKNPFGGI